MTKEAFLRKIKKPEDNTGILEKMKSQKLPLIIWGGGSLAYSVRRLLRREGLSITACWIDCCKRGERIDGIPVMELDEIHQKYGRVNVVCGHSRYELADDVKNKYAFIEEVYCLVNVCYGQWKAITYDFVESHVNEYFKTYELLEDEKSRECMIAYLNCKLNEDYRYLLPCCGEKAGYFRNPFFKMTEYEDYVDVGAYDGDTIREFLGTVSSYNNLYALEPEKDSYAKLVEYGKREGLKNIFYFPYGSWKEDTFLCFEENEESSGIGTGEGDLQVYRLDTLLANKRVTMIKINFLAGVAETLQGAAGILKEQKPKLAVTVGFDEWGMIRIAQAIKELNPDYKIDLRYAASMPARLILFAR